ncbi:MAG: YceI family protein [Pseudomonadota bacterium]
MKQRLMPLLLAASLALAAVPARAELEHYVIDTKNAHAFIQFKISHLGYSWVIGRFNTFAGGFSYDPRNPAASKVDVSIDTASIDSNHAERDKHLRSDDFLDVGKYPKASFVSTGYSEGAGGQGQLKGELTLHGVTRPVVIETRMIGHGKDPWGGYRRGFEGTTTLKLKDYGIKKDLGPASQEVELFLSIEGVRQP